MGDRGTSALERARAVLDPEIAFAFRFAKKITAEQLARLRRKKWVRTRRTSASSTSSIPPTTSWSASTDSPT